MTDREALLLDALKWAFRYVGRPSQRLVGQNDGYYDRYMQIERLIKEMEKAS